MADIDNVTVGENNYNLRDSAAQNALPTQGQVDDIITALNTIANKTDHPYNPDNKLPSDYVNDANQTHKFATAAQLSQIETNKNNILLSEQMNGAKNLINWSIVPSSVGTDGNVHYAYTNNSISITGTKSVTNSYITWAEGVLFEANTDYVAVNEQSSSQNVDIRLSIYGKINGSWVELANTGTYKAFNTSNSTEYMVRFIVVCDNGTTVSKTVKPMIITKEAYDAGFTDYQPYALPNTAITPALVECVDKGSKNIANIPDSTITGSSYVFDNVACNIPVGSYVFSYTSNQSQSGNVEFIVKNSGGTTIFSKTVTSQSGRVAIPFTIAETGAKLTLYSVRAGTYSNFMICTEAEYKASQTYQPYAMSNVELTNKTNEIGIVKTIVPITPSAANVYECITASKITLPAGKILRISASCIYQNSFATGIAIVRGTTKENSKILGISESTTDYNALSVSTVCSFGSDQDIYVFLQCNSTGTTKLVMSYDIISP